MAAMVLWPMFLWPATHGLPDAFGLTFAAVILLLGADLRFETLPPARLLALVRRWLEAGAARNFCCTIKFQGETDHAAAAEFAAIPGAVVFHGAHNKHELMFLRLG